MGDEKANEQCPSDEAADEKDAAAGAKAGSSDPRMASRLNKANPAYPTDSTIARRARKPCAEAAWCPFALNLDDDEREKREER